LERIWKEAGSDIVEVLFQHLLSGTEKKSRESFFYWYCGHYWPIVPAPQMIGDGDCGEIGGIKFGRGN
jgi:hypothetical protein